MYPHYAERDDGELSMMAEMAVAAAGQALAQAGRSGADVDMVLSATPIDLTRIIKVNKPMQRVRYELQEIGKPSLEDVLREKFGKK